MIETIHVKGKSYRDGYYRFRSLSRTWSFVKREGRETRCGPLHEGYASEIEMLEVMLADAQTNPEIAEEDRSLGMRRIQRRIRDLKAKQQKEST